MVASFGASPATVPLLTLAAAFEAFVTLLARSLIWLKWRSPTLPSYMDKRYSQVWTRKKQLCSGTQETLNPFFCPSSFILCLHFGFCSFLILFLSSFSFQGCPLLCHHGSLVRYRLFCCCCLFWENIYKQILEELDKNCNKMKYDREWMSAACEQEEEGTDVSETTDI